MSGDLQEPILHAANPNEKYYLLPIRYPAIYDFYKKVESTIWNANEIVLTDDLMHFKTLSTELQTIIKRVLGFFAAADGIVNHNLNTNFADEVIIPEIKLFYGLQMYIEGVHQITYFNILNVYIEDDEEKQRLFRSIETDPVIKKKADWALRWIGADSDAEKKPFAQRLLAFACVEGIHFAASFATIFWLRRDTQLRGMIQANEFIARDETTHWQFAALVHEHLQQKVDQTTAEQIVREAVELECEFVHDLFDGTSLLGLNSKLMVQYIQSIANMIMQYFHLSDVYPGAENPFEFTRMMNMHSYANFFERQETGYTAGTEDTDDIFEDVSLVDY